ncbi:MAG: hypothetical protein ACOX2X_03810 [Peptococcia bacterium]|jgi:hypothetical protein
MDKVEKLFILVERISFFGVIVLLVTLLFIQAIFLIPGMAARLNLALRIEGERINENGILYLAENSEAGNISSLPWNSITLELLEYQSRPDVEIEVNGVNAGNFLRKEITLNVTNGDLLNLYNPNEQHPVKIKVSKKTMNIISPELGTVVTGIGRCFFPPIRMK